MTSLRLFLLSPNIGSSTVRHSLESRVAGSKQIGLRLFGAPLAYGCAVTGRCAAVAERLARSRAGRS